MPSSPESHDSLPGFVPLLHCASPSTAFGVNPAPWTTTCWPSSKGPAGVIVRVGGVATAVGSTPSGTSETTSGSSTDCTRITHVPTASEQFVGVSAMMTTPPSDGVMTRCTWIDVSTTPLPSACEHVERTGGRAARVPVGRRSRDALRDEDALTRREPRAVHVHEPAVGDVELR